MVETKIAIDDVISPSQSSTRRTTYTRRHPRLWGRASSTPHSPPGSYIVARSFGTNTFAYTLPRSSSSNLKLFGTVSGLLHGTLLHRGQGERQKISLGDILGTSCTSQIFLIGPSKVMVDTSLNKKKKFFGCTPTAQDRERGPQRLVHGSSLQERASDLHYQAPNTSRDRYPCREQRGSYRHL